MKRTGLKTSGKQLGMSTAKSHAVPHSINFDEWRKALEEVAGKNAPPGWITAREFTAMQDASISIQGAREQLKKLVKAERAECQLFRVATGKQLLHYRLKKA